MWTESWVLGAPEQTKSRRFRVPVYAFRILSSRRSIRDSHAARSLARLEV